MKITGRKDVISWCLYYWANHGFALTVLAGFFPVFFKSYWCAGVPTTISTARLGIGNTIAGLIIAVLSLLMGAAADAGGTRKRFLGIFAVAGIVATALLFCVGSGKWQWALAVFIAGDIGYACANLFYDSLLIDVAEKNEMDFVSSLGFGAGYLGGGLLFCVNVVMVMRPSFFHLSGSSNAVKVSFLSASGWWLLFSIPLFVFVRERVYSRIRGVGAIVKESVRRVVLTGAKIVKQPLLLTFLIAYWLYIDGVNTFIMMAVDFGLSIGFSSGSLMVALLVVQFVAFPCAILFGRLAGRFGAGKMIMAGIVIYIAVTSIGALTLRTEFQFIVLAGITGMAQGCVQALSRSYFGKLIPPRESAEYFGFYNIVNRFAMVGPAIVGIIGLVSRGLGLHPHTASRLGMSSVSLLFIGGGALFVLAERMRREIVPPVTA